MVDVVEYICCCGDVAVVEIRVIHSTITLLYVKSQWAIKLVHYKVKYINNEVALMVKKRLFQFLRVICWARLHRNSFLQINKRQQLFYIYPRGNVISSINMHKLIWPGSGRSVAANVKLNLYPTNDITNNFLINTIWILVCALFYERLTRIMHFFIKASVIFTLSS